MVLYHLSIRALGWIMLLAALFHPKAKKWRDGRRNWRTNLPQLKGNNVIWFHCASLGEFEQGRPIIEAWKDQSPDDFLLLTFFSPSGYEVRKDYPHVDHCCYLPLDTFSNSRDFVQHFQPSRVFFVKYEFWLNYIHAAADTGSKVYSLSAIFRPNQRFFKWYGGPFRKALLRFEYFFVQNETSSTLLKGIGVKNTLVTGDTRYDRVMDRVLENKRNGLLDAWLGDERAFVVGSSWPEDEAVFMESIDTNYSGKVIIAPHEVNASTIARLERLLNVPHMRYSDAQEQGAIPKETNVLILNCVGVLADAYRYGSFAYVGGAFRTGLHNILEPAAFGLPVIFGPNHTKFPEAELFVDQGVGFSIANQEAFQTTFSNLLKAHQTLKPRVEAVVASQTGARDKILAQLFPTKA